MIDRRVRTCTVGVVGGMGRAGQINREIKHVKKRAWDF